MKKIEDIDLPVNKEVWTLFQICDGVTERWSPVYCLATETAIRLECKELVKKQPNRPFVMRVLGTISDKTFMAIAQPDQIFGEFAEEDFNASKVSAAGSNLRAG